LDGHPSPQGTSLGLLTAAEAKALKTAVSGVRFFQQPAAERSAWLLNALTAALQPGNASLAGTIATSMIDALGAGIVQDRMTAKDLLASAAGAALTGAQKSWINSLIALPENVPVLPQVKAIMGLTPADRDRPAAYFATLSGP
jgi:hypothetical protein